MLSRIRRLVVLMVAVGGIAVLHAGVPVTFSTTGVFSVSGTNVVNFTNVSGTTTITFNGTTNAVNDPAGTQFGDFVVTTTVPANVPGPAIAGTFTLNIIQVSPAATTSLVGTLSGNLGFNSGIGTLTLTTSTGTAIPAAGTNFTYTASPTTYNIAAPVTGVGGGAVTGTTTIEGTVTSPPAANIPLSAPAARKPGQQKGAR